MADSRRTPPPGASADLWSTTTIGALALRILRRYPDRAAFVEGDRVLSYGAVVDLVGRLQGTLAAHGIRPGDRVGLLAGNSAEAWCAGLALQASGVVITWLHPMGSLDDQLHQLADLDAAACLVQCPTHAARGAEIAARADGVRVFALGAGELGRDLLADAAAHGVARAQDVARVDAVAQVAYTGGTTGRPKGAMRRHGGLVSVMALGTLADFEIPAEPRYLAVAPITHVAGTKVLPVLSRGGTVHLLDGFDPARVLSVIERERISMTLAVPTMVSALLDHPDLDRTDLSSLEVLLYGAAPMPAARLADGLERIGPVFSQLYGQTECYPISVLPRADHADPTLRGTCGLPLTTVQVALLDPAGHEVPDGEPGEIGVRGPGVMEEYWRRPDLTAEAFAGGWLHTGDVARRDDRGYLTIVDRTKDLIITGGFNVYPREVEDALTSHAAVAMAAVFGRDDDRWGEAVIAAVVLRPGATATADDLVRHVRERKGPVQTPKTIRILDALPTTAVGKIDKRALKAQET